MTTLGNLSALTTVGAAGAPANLNIQNNDGLVDLGILTSLASVSGSIQVFGNDKLKTLGVLNALSVLGGNLHIQVPPAVRDGVISAVVAAATHSRAPSAH